MLRQISIFWVILTALALTSAVPVGLIAFLEVGATHDEVEREASVKFEDRARAEAAIFDEQLGEFRLTTDLAATQAQKLLTRTVGTVISEEEVQNRLEKYSFSGEFGLFGRDAWFNERYFPATHNDRVSNAFLEEGRDLTPAVAYTVAVTEGLDPLFNALSEALDRSTTLGLHNIFLITHNGVMRWFPFVTNDFTPIGAFTEMPEYVEAGPGANPERAPVWFDPQIDTGVSDRYFVVNLVPIYDGETYLGVMAHDLDLATLGEVVTDMKVGDSGLALVVDYEGHVVFHRDYDPVGLWQGLDEATREALLEDQVALDRWYEEHFDIPLDRFYPDIRLADILATERGLLTYRDGSEDWSVAYHRIAETRWMLILMQPRAELVKTATTISSRVQRAALITLGLVFVASLVLARQVTRPVLQLAQTARGIKAAVDDETGQAIGRHLHQLADIKSMREINNLAGVFEGMVSALQKRMVELDSIYTMGQTITANVDYEATLQAILSAVQQVVKSDAAEIAVKRGDQLVVDAWVGSPEYKNTTGHSYPTGTGLMGELQKEAEALFMPHVPQESQFAMETEQREVRSLLALPLAVGGRFIGAMVLVHHEPGYFSEDAHRQLKKLAAQASIAIDNAVKVRERESKLKQQIEELKIEIDQSKRQAQVTEISDSDFFRNLQNSAAQLRQRAARRQKQGEQAPPRDEEGESPPKGGSE